MSRYSKNPLIPYVTNKRNKTFPIQRSIRYPEIPLDVNDTYVYTTIGDRLDLLSQQFYGDVSLWWIIASANPDVLALSSIQVPDGIELRIPASVTLAKSLFNQINRI